MNYRALAGVSISNLLLSEFQQAAARAAGVEPQQDQALLAINRLPLDRRATVGTLAERCKFNITASPVAEAGARPRR